MRSVGWVLLFLPCAALAGERGAVRLRGFEPEEMKAFGKPGKPIGTKSPAPGFRAEPPDPNADSYAIYDAAGSRDWPKLTLFKAHATEGAYALRYDVGDWHERYSRQPSITGHPPIGGYHDVDDWLWQRHCLIWSEGDARRPLDWSAFDRLRFDAFSSDAPAVLGVRVRDASATEGRPAPHPHGIRTALAVFRVPKGQAVTCEFRLAAMARVAEADLARVHWMHIRLNAFEGRTSVFLDNLRLVPKGAEEPKLPLVTMEGEPRPFARKVWDKNPPPAPARELPRELGPVERLGPVTVLEAPGGYACGYGHLGGPGATYFQSARRGVAAWDSRRLAIVVGASVKERARPFTWGGVGESGGVVLLASHDGGRTWGGPRPGDDKPLLIQDWYWRATMASDASGAIYSVGTQNCDSYVEGYDVFFRRLAFDGTGWTYNRFSLIDQDGYKCPGPARALRLASGRLWAAWSDGFGGIYAKPSDDDGLTWKPCKDASVATLPRPFYEPRPGTPPPKEVLLWPAEPVAGPLLVPCKGQVAAIAYDGSRWAAHDGNAWGPTEKVPWKAARGGQASEAILGAEHLFLARCEGEKDAKTLVALQLRDGKWTDPETLAAGKLGSSILTASGDAVFCFYVLEEAAEGKPLYTIYLRRWANGSWGAPEKIATETDRINELAAPTVCPPTYAALFWDQWTDNPKQSTWLRFARIPNR